jgi:hypothetical protein
VRERRSGVDFTGESGFESKWYSLICGRSASDNGASAQRRKAFAMLTDIDRIVRFEWSRDEREFELHR